MELDKDKNFPGHLRDDLRELFKNRTIIIVLITLTIRFAVGFARGFFEPIAWHILYPDQYATYATMNGLALLICPIPGYLLIGKFTDMHEKDRPYIRPLII
jgi:hypothetical protein